MCQLCLGDWACKLLVHSMSQKSVVSVEKPIVTVENPVADVVSTTSAAEKASASV